MSKVSFCLRRLKVHLERCSTNFKVTVFRKGKTNQVLFLETGKDFVDSLFSFLLLPVGTILHILSEISTKYLEIGVNRPLIGMSGIFTSVDDSILQVDKQDLLQPRPSDPGCTCGTCSTSSLQVVRDLESAQILRSPVVPKMKEVLPEDYFKCTNHNCDDNHLSSNRGERCTGSCQKNSGIYKGYYCVGPYSVQMKDQFVKKDSGHFKSGFVKENIIRFIVTDNLEIIPSNSTTIMNTLRKMDVSSVDGPAESIEMFISITQILQLLHSALVSNTCLNDIFGPKK